MSPMCGFAFLFLNVVLRFFFLKWFCVSFFEEYILVISKNKYVVFFNLISESVGLLDVNIGDCLQIMSGSEWNGRNIIAR